MCTSCCLGVLGHLHLASLRNVVLHLHVLRLIGNGTEPDYEDLSKQQANPRVGETLSAEAHADSRKGIDRGP